MVIKNTSKNMENPKTNTKSSQLNADGNNNKINGTKIKEKRRNNEKRKEKSRDAARSRRSRETELYSELENALPLGRENALDKASIMRLTIAFLRCREMLNLFPCFKNSPEPEETEQKIKLIENSKDIVTRCALQALDGFLLIISGDGDVTYVSENIKDVLGICQIDIMGQPIWEYSHQCDHDELREALNGRRTSPSEIQHGKLKNDVKPLVHRDFFLRLKCTLTTRGRSVNIKSASYKVIHVSGHIVTNDDGQRQLISVGCPLPHPSNIQIPLGSTTFLSKHSLDMKFSYVDENMFSLLGYNPKHLLGKSLYDYHHGGDSDSLMVTFKTLISKGQTETCRYRFLARNGGYSWIVTQATLVYDKQKPQSVVCVNYVISGIENKNEIYSCAQLEALKEEQQQQQQQEDQQQQHIIVKSEEKEEKLNDKIKINSIEINSNIKNIFEEITGTNEIKTATASPININNNDQKLISVTTISNDTIITDKSIVDTSNKNNIKSVDLIDRDCVNNLTNNNIIQQQQEKEEEQQQQTRSITASLFSIFNSNSELIDIERENLSSSSTSLLTELAEESQLQQQQQQQTRPYSLTANLFTPISSILPSPQPQPVTLKLFVPRTEEMNKGFLMFSEEEPGLTMLKDEPDDLTHLAPTAGDACIPLEETTPFFSDMFEGLILPDNYCTLLSEDINSLDSQSSSKGHNTDPFINYRDESSDTSGTPNILSPGLSKSPEGSSLPSLCSPNGSLPEEELTFMTMNIDDDLDLSMRTSYIPMNETDDLPLLSEDLMWGAFPEGLSLHKEIKALNNNYSNHHSNNNNNNNHSTIKTEKLIDSSLAALLCNANGNIIVNGNCNINDNNNIETSITQQQHQQTHLQLEQQQQHQTNNSHQIQQQHIRKTNIIDHGGGHNNNDSVTRECCNDLVNPNDVLNQVFNKNCTNIQNSWTMNDLLQLNAANSTITTGATKTALSSQQQQQSTGVNVTTPITINNSTQLSSLNTKLPPQLLLTTQQLKKSERALNNNKRPSNLSTIDLINNSKRIKSSSTASLSSLSPSSSSSSSSEPSSPQSSPHLLQQLMAPSPSAQNRSRSKNHNNNKNNLDGRWNIDSGQNQMNELPQQTSGSVLMNLLVSGCDVSAGYVCFAPIRPKKTVKA